MRRVASRPRNVKGVDLITDFRTDDTVGKLKFGGLMSTPCHFDNHRIGQKVLQGYRSNRRLWSGWSKRDEILVG